MLRGILSILANAIYCVVLNLHLYTDKAKMPEGAMKVWHRSPIERLILCDQALLLILQLALAAASVVTSIMLLAGAKSSTVKTVQLVSTVASTVMFVIIMIVTAFSHPKYS